MSERVKFSFNAWDSCRIRESWELWNTETENSQMTSISAIFTATYHQEFILYMVRESVQCPYALYKHTALSYDVNAIDSRGVNSFEALCSLNFWQIQTCNLFKLRIDWCVFILNMIIQCGRWYKQLEYLKMMKEECFEDGTNPHHFLLQIINL